MCNVFDAVFIFASWAVGLWGCYQTFGFLAADQGGGLFVSFYLLRAFSPQHNFR